MSVRHSQPGWQHFGTPDYRPVNLYAATKQAFEDVLAYYADAQGIAAVTLELYDTYGPGDPRRKLIRILFEAARSGEPIQLSPGEQVIELLHVDDAVPRIVKEAKDDMLVIVGAVLAIFASSMAARFLARSLGTGAGAIFGEILRVAASVAAGAGMRT